MRHLYTFLLIGVILSATVGAAWVQWNENHDWKTVEKVLGYPGQAQGSAFKVLVPRTDLNVLVHGLWLDPQAGLLSWFLFEPQGSDCLLTGELTVVDGEVSLVEEKLLAQGFTLTAFYRPFTGETPGVERVRFQGRDRRVRLAQKARMLLEATGMSFKKDMTASPTGPQTWEGPVQKVLGVGRPQGAFLSFNYKEASVTEPLGPESVFYFQPEGKQTLVYGQFEVVSEKVNDTLSSLLRSGLSVTGTSPDLGDPKSGRVLVNFWAQGEAVPLAKAIQKVLQAGLFIEEPSAQQAQTGQTQQR